MRTIKKVIEEVIEYEVGDHVKVKKAPKQAVGIIVYVHPTDDVKYVVDFGDEWWGYYGEDLKPAEPKKS